MKSGRNGVSSDQQSAKTFFLITLGLISRRFRRVVIPANPPKEDKSRNPEILTGCRIRSGMTSDTPLLCGGVVHLSFAESRKLKADRAHP
jgi:hypothetical protein